MLSDITTEAEEMIEICIEDFEDDFVNEFPILKTHMEVKLLVPVSAYDILHILQHELRSFHQPRDIPNLSRRLEVALCRIRTGYTILTHKHLFTKDYLPICP